MSTTQNELALIKNRIAICERQISVYMERVLTTRNSPQIQGKYKAMAAESAKNLVNSLQTLAAISKK